MSRYTSAVARKKFSRRIGPDHLIGKPDAKATTSTGPSTAMNTIMMNIIRNGVNGTTGFYSGSEYISPEEFKGLQKQFGRTFEEQANIYISRGNVLKTDINKDRAAVNAGTLSRAEWNKRYPTEKFDPSKKTGLFGGIANVVGDAVKLAVAPVTLATGGNVELKTGVGKVVGDASKIAIAPVTGAVSSIKGAQVDLKLQTNAGKKVNAVVETGNKALHGALKGFGDAVTLGYATKGVNLIRSKDNKEKAFQYSEMKPTKDKTGIGFIDKISEKLPTYSAVAGGVVASVIGGTKIADLVGGNKSEGSMKPTELQVGENVLDYQLPNNQQAPLKASYEFKPWHIAAVVGAIILLIVVSKYAKR